MNNAPPVITVQWKQLWKVFKILLRIFSRLLILGIIVAVFIVFISHLSAIKNIHVNSDLLLQYVNALKYPLLILFFGLIFQQPIRKFISEADEASYKGATVRRQTPARSNDATSEIASISPDSVRPVGSTSSEPAQAGEQTEEEEIHEFLTSPEAVSEFHRVFSAIWGSQFKALQKLNSYRDGLAEDDLQEFLQLHLSATERDNLHSDFESVSDLMAYPVSESLAKYDPTTRTYHLTYAGLYFLNYMTDRGLGDNLLY